MTNRRTSSGQVDWNQVLSLLVGGVIIVLMLSPILPLLMWSVSSRWFFPSLVPPEISLRAWKYLTSDTARVLPGLWQGTTIALTATLLSVLVGVPAGRAIGLHRFRGRRLVEFLILAPNIIPGLAVVMGIHIIFIRYGLAGSWLGVVLVHLIPTTPYVVMVMSSVFANYEPEYEEQARSLGATKLQTLRCVMLPAIFPGLMVAAMFAFVLSWGQYLLTLMIGGGRVVTLPLLLFSFASSGDNAVAGALSVVYLAPAILMLLVTSRYLTGESAALGGMGV